MNCTKEMAYSLPDPQWAPYAMDRGSVSEAEMKEFRGMAEGGGSRSRRDDDDGVITKW